MQLEWDCHADPAAACADKPDVGVSLTICASWGI